MRADQSIKVSASSRIRYFNILTPASFLSFHFLRYFLEIPVCSRQSIDKYAMAHGIEIRLLCAQFVILFYVIKASSSAQSVLPTPRLNRGIEATFDPADAGQ